MARSSKGVAICFVKSSATGTAETITALSKAKPPVATIGDTTGLKDGDLIKFAANSTGFTSLDGKTFPIKIVTPGTTDFQIVGADTTNETGTFTAGTAPTVTGSTDCQAMCFSEFSFNKEDPQQISTGTYCNPQDAISSAATSAGTVSFAGYIDVTDAGYQELLDLEVSGATVQVKISFPGNGYILVPITIDSITWDIPLDGALAFSGTGTMKENPRHLF